MRKFAVARRVPAGLARRRDGRGATGSWSGLCEARANGSGAEFGVGGRVASVMREPSVLGVLGRAAAGSELRG